MKELLRAGLLHGDVMTVTGKTLAENLAAVPTLDEIAPQDIVFPVKSPIAPPKFDRLAEKPSSSRGATQAGISRVYGDAALFAEGSAEHFLTGAD